MILGALSWNFVDVKARAAGYINSTMINNMEKGCH